MLVNENNGSYGMFSRAGRNSTEKFHILMKKDEILNGTGRKFKPPKFFFHNKDEGLKNNHQIEKAEEPQEVFLQENIEEKPKDKKELKKHDKIFQYKKSDIFMSNLKKLIDKKNQLNIVPGCTKYDPRNAFIWKKSKQFPTWESSLPKHKSIKEKEFIAPKFYRETAFKLDCKNFVDMSRQIDRKSFIEVKDYEITDDNYININNQINEQFSNVDNRTQSGFGKFNNLRKALKSAGLLHRKGNLDLKSMKNNNSDFISEMDLNNKDIQNINEENFNEIDHKNANNVEKNNYNLFYENNPKNNNAENYDINYNTDEKWGININSRFLRDMSPTRNGIASIIKHKKNKSNYNSAYAISSNNIMRSSRSAGPNSTKRWIKIQAPDFKKIISRENREKAFNDKKRIVPFTITPYEKTRPSIFLLVILHFFILLSFWNFKS